MQLFDQAATNISSDVMEWQGGTGNVVCEGTFDGCTVTIYAQWEDGAWHALAAPAPFTAAGIQAITLRKGFNVKGVISSAGTTLIDLHIIHPAM
jgi:hypothetical protein